MKKSKLVSYQLLCKRLDPAKLDFTTTAELKPLTEFLGQERALESVSFGIGIKSQGYNLFAMGPSGIGKRSLIRSILKNHAINEATPSDWCYIHNFETPEKPIALQLPAGLGSGLQQDMKLFVEELGTNILSIFESDEYRNGMRDISDDFNKKREKSCKKSAESTRSDKIPHLYKERHQKEKALQFRLVSAIVKPLVKKLKDKYSEFVQVVGYLSSVEEHIITHVNELIKQDESTNILSFALENPILTKYQINLLVDHSKRNGAPVIFEENPSYSTLISRVEHVNQFGTQATNFTLIRPGSLHQANGGYLIIEARKLKKDQQAWESLKRALYSRKIHIEPVEHPSDSIHPVSLEPMPIPLHIKVVLMGNRSQFYSLCNHDPDFSELFKVAVDFDEQINRTDHNIALYARLIGTIAFKAGLRPFQADAVAAIIDYSSRLAADSEKLSTHIRNIDDLTLESDYWASLEHKKIVSAEDVRKAIRAQIHRMDREKELYFEDIKRDFILIETTGKTIGQINCLSVVKVGNYSYGHPTRVTAKVRMGKGQIIDIHRDIKMSGPLHSKGVLTLSNFLADRYNQSHPFSLTASLAFEQIYAMVDGDSASVAEVCALLSALAEVPILQSLSVTGSIDQSGHVQAIGGANEKIEGFFEICRMRGLTGSQGVLIPTVNLKNLMLHDEVVEAAKKKKFFVYAIDTVDEAITLLTGCPAGKRNTRGKFPKDTINYLVEKRLENFSRHYIRRGK